MEPPEDGWLWYIGFSNRYLCRGRLLFLTEMKADFEGHKHNAYYANDF